MHGIHVAPIEGEYVNFQSWSQWGREQAAILPGRNDDIAGLAAAHAEIDDSMKVSRYLAEYRYQELSAIVIPGRRITLHDVVNDELVEQTILIGLNLEPPLVFSHPVHRVLRRRLLQSLEENTALADLMLGGREEEFDASDGEDVAIYEEVFGRKLKDGSFIANIRELKRICTHIEEMDTLASSGRIPSWHPQFPLESEPPEGG